MAPGFYLELKFHLKSYFFFPNELKLNSNPIKHDTNQQKVQMNSVANRRYNTIIF